MSAHSQPDAKSGRREVDNYLPEILRSLNDLCSRVAKIEQEVKQALTGPIEAHRLRWGAKEIFWLLLFIIIPAIAAYFGTKSQVEQMQQMLTEQISIHRSVGK